MKSRQICVLLAILLIFPVLSLAKLPNIYFMLGIAKIMSPEETKSNYVSGAHVGIMAGLPLTSYFELVGDVNFHLSTFNNQGYRSTLPSEDRITDNYTITGDNASVFTMMLKAKLMMGSQKESRSLSYFFAGGGLFTLKTGDTEWYYYNDNQDDHAFIPGKTQTVPGFTFGLGFELMMESTIFTIELGPTLGLTEDKTTVVLPLRLGLAIKP